MLQALENIVASYPGMPTEFYYKLVIKNIKEVTPQTFIELGRVIGKKESAKQRDEIINNLTKLCQRQN